MKLKLIKIFPYTIALVLLAFGLLTLFLSSSIIFDLFGIRAKEGNYVLFVVVSNFICSILYLSSAYGIIKNRSWTPKVLSISVVILLISFIGLSVYIYLGGIYETKTIGANIFRISLTLLFAGAAYLLSKRIEYKK